VNLCLAFNTKSGFIFRDFGCMKKIFGILILVLILQGCRSAMLYTSNNIPIPLMHEVRETQIAVEYGMNGTNINIVASPLENVALSFSGITNKISEKSNVSEDGYQDENSHNYSEIAVGYYSKINEKYIAEFYTGYGRGSGRDQNFVNYFLGNKIHSNLSEGKFDKYFLQANFGSREKNLTIGFALRFSYLNFYQLIKENDGVLIFPSKKEGLFVEPALFARFGGKNIMLELQFLFPYAQKDIDFDYRGIIISTGLRFIF